jgi:chemotaxis protein methyltransferase CheR
VGRTAMNELTTEQFTRLRDLVCSNLGLFFEESRSQYLQKRVEKRMEALSFNSAEDYIRHLRFHDPIGSEMQQFANLITTNETYMFREFDQLRAFSDHALPEVLETKKKKGDNRLRIWSAGCSTGEEPYTLAIILREVLHDTAAWNVEITATDIDENALARVRQGFYDQRSIRHVPAEYMDRHFRREDGHFRLRPETREMVVVEHLNLYDRTAMRAYKRFDFIFCRNVLIYFSDETRKAVVDYFYTALNMGGFIFLGHSESVGRISNAFKLVRLGEHLSYKK